MSVNQILAKALSTSSEEEAIACLRMARKKGGMVEGQEDTYNHHTAKHWYQKAYDYHKIAKERTEEVKDYYAMYARERDKARELEKDVEFLKTKLENIKGKLDYVIPAIGALTMVFVSILIGFLSK